MRRVLSDRFVKSATTGRRKSPIFTDDEVIGFALQGRTRQPKTETIKRWRS
jgi:hypothetical protein